MVALLVFLLVILEIACRTVEVNIFETPARGQLDIYRLT